MNKILDESSKRYVIDDILKKACKNADVSLKRYEQLIYKRLDENKEVKLC